MIERESIESSLQKQQYVEEEDQFLHSKKKMKDSNGSEPMEFVNTSLVMEISPICMGKEGNKEQIESSSMDNIRGKDP